MKDYFKMLNSENPQKRIEGLEALANDVSITGKEKETAIIKLKEMILDWDENVRAKVSSVLKLLTGK